jgi:ABC-type multidrug transport system ATPase subunit
MSQLTKIYPNGKVAVNQLSLGIAPGECFGLLGINGAGYVLLRSHAVTRVSSSSLTIMVFYNS